MDIEHYKTRLKAEEKRLTDGIARAEAAGQDPGDVQIGDAADRSTVEEQKEEVFRRADSESARLRQVRQTLERVKNGVYGRCVVDGAPIEKERLDAEPWTPVCRRHQEEYEQAHPPQIATL